MKPTMKKLLIVLLVIGWSYCHAQLQTEQIAKIDSLFLQWNTPNHPGGAIGIMQDDKIVFSKAYGLASMEYLVPNSTGTRFNVASVSKQFSALGIVLLHLQGKISIDDTIDQYIDGLAPFASKVTIRHMLHHTSGLRSLHTLFGLAGWRSDDSRTNADLNRIMAKQEELNFEPGSEYLYCNTGFMFMATIIEKVSGRSFGTYMQEEIFVPLGMYDTYVEGEYDRIVPNNATSYNHTDDGFIRSVEYWGYVGSGNIHTTTKDLLTYLKNFYDPLPGWDSPFKIMQTLDPLNDGSFNQYAFGVNVDSLYGRKRISHGGSIGGFRSNIAVFPGDRTSIVIITNFSSSGPAKKSNKIAEVIFGKPPKKPIEVAKIPKSKMASYVGTYWDDITVQERRVTINGDTLFIGNGNSKTAFLPITKNEFITLDPENATRIEFNGKVMTFHPKSGKPSLYTKYKSEPLTPQRAEEYVGTYYSKELETAYTVHYEDGKLFAHHIRHGTIPLEQKMDDLLEGDYPLNTMKFKKENNKIIGVHISNGRVRNLWFEKRPE